MTGVRKFSAYEMTGAQKRTHVYTPTDCQKTREYEVTGARKKKTDAYDPTDSQKTREYEVIGHRRKLMCTS